MTRLQVLDHGYVEFIEAWGTGEGGKWTSSNGTRTVGDYEVGIIEAARQSTQGNFRGWEEDERLLGFLYNNRHATPFEFAGMVLEVQAPIFVFREWHRHRTQSYNEMSARYAPLPPLYYEPTAGHVLERAKVAAQTRNKQAQGLAGVELTKDDAARWVDLVNEHFYQSENLYQWGLSVGIPKEIAREVNPLGHYSRMRVHTSLRCWLMFLTLRMDPAAQWEIREYAGAVGNFIANTFPKTWKQFKLGLQK